MGLNEAVITSLDVRWPDHLNRQGPERAIKPSVHDGQALLLVVDPVVGQEAGEPGGDLEVCLGG